MALEKVNFRRQFYWRYRKAHCQKCGVNIFDLCAKGLMAWRKLNGQGRAIYWCNPCKQDLFEGVKIKMKKCPDCGNNLDEHRDGKICMYCFRLVERREYE